MTAPSPAEIEAAAQAAYEANYGHPPTIPIAELAGWQEVAEAALTAASAVRAADGPSPTPDPDYVIDTLYATLREYGVFKKAKHEEWAKLVLADAYARAVLRGGSSPTEPDAAQ